MVHLPFCAATAIIQLTNPQIYCLFMLQCMIILIDNFRQRFDFGHQIILATSATRQYFTTTGLVKSSSVSFGAEKVLRFLSTVASIAEQVTIFNFEIKQRFAQNFRNSII